ncbi:MAG: hypothetical protein R3D02_05060 [Hyphomicrobiales bacterium]
MHISGGEPAGKERSALEKGIDGDDAREAAHRQLVGLVAAYGKLETGYLSRARPMKERYAGRYDRLARVAEWTSAEDEEGEE